MTLTTWRLLSKIKTLSPDTPFIYHYHIPKTGGTSIFANLLDTTSWIPFNTDQETEILIGKINAFRELNRSGSPKLFGRSHNNANSLARFHANTIYDQAFSFYRDPMSIHISNMNMIVSRILCLQSGVTPRQSDIGRWTIKWINILNLSADSDSFEIVEKLLASEDYILEYSSILSKYFPVSPYELKRWLNSWKLLILDMKLLDGFQSLVFNIQSPKIRNQIKTEYITRDMIGGSSRRRLIGNDARMADALQSVLVSTLDDISLHGMCRRFDR